MFSTLDYKKTSQSYEQYCYWDVRSSADYWITVFNIVVASVLLVKVLIAFQRSVKYLQPSAQYYIYCFLICWCIAYTTQYSYALAYYQDFKKEDKITYYSIRFELMDFLGGLMLLGCLFFVSYQLLKRIHDHWTSNGNHLTKPEYYFYKALKYYQFFRILYIIPTALLFNFDIQKEISQIQRQSYIELSFFLLDSLLCNLALFIAMRTLRHKSKLLLILKQRQRKRLKKESLALQVAGGIRFILGLIILVISRLWSEQCTKGNIFRTIFYIGFGQILMQFVPVFVVLSIFSISSQELKKRNNSMVSSSHSLTEGQS